METPADRPESSTGGEGSETEPPLVQGQGGLRLEAVVEAGDWSALQPLEPLLEAVARAIACAPALAPRFAEFAEACVAFASDAEVQALNASYRAKDKPTNVLSFPAPPMPGRGAGEARMLGDIILAAETVAAEAREQGIPLSHHVQHLIVHGTLHLLGFDHESDAEAEAMEGEERRILASLGIADPYTENH